MRLPSVRLVFLLLAVYVPSVAAQQAPAPVTPARDTGRAHALDTMKVSGRIDDLIGTATSASEGRVGAAELRARPITREGELLETVPGVIVTQHSGEGKANQYFVVSFNLDHGTDFQTRLEGMPLNLPSHGHGQGYTDLNFLIPEMVEYLDYKLGVYHPEVGDFGSAGAATLARIPSSRRIHRVPRPTTQHPELAERARRRYSEQLLVATSRRKLGRRGR